MKNDNLYVLAANQKHAGAFCFERGRACVNVDNPEKLMGLREVKLYVLPGADQRPNYYDILQEAKIREIEVEYVL